MRPYVLPDTWYPVDVEPDRHLTRGVLALCILAGLVFWGFCFWVGYAVWPVLP
jgi:hypothetical protein